MSLGWHVSSLHCSVWCCLSGEYYPQFAFVLHIFISTRYWRFIGPDESGLDKHVLGNTALVVGNNKVLAQMNSSYVIARDILLLLRSVFVQLFPFPLSEI